MSHAVTSCKRRPPSGPNVPVPAVSVPGLGIAKIPNASAAVSAAGPAAQIGAMPQAQALGVEAGQKNPAFTKVFDKALGGPAESGASVAVPSMGVSAAGPALSASTAKLGGASAKSPASPKASVSAAGGSWSQQAARWLKTKFAVLLLAAAALPGCGGNGSSSHGTPGGTYDPDYVEYLNGHAIATVEYDSGLVAQEDALINRINDYRLSIGLLPLDVDPTLGDVARGDAKHMDQHEYVSTVTPEGDTFTQRVDLTYGAPVYFFNGETVMADWTLTDDYWAFEEMYWDYDASTQMEDPYLTHIGVGRRSNWAWSRAEGWAVGYGEY